MAQTKQTTKKNDAKVAKKETKEQQVKHAQIVAETTPAATAQSSDMEIEKTAAKAGKRSSKAQKEEAQKEAKQDRKAAAAKPAETTKTGAKPARRRADRAGKKYRAAAKLVDKSKLYPLNEALDLAIKTSPSKFDGTVEMHVNLGVDPRQADQNVRDTVALPAGTGKSVRIESLATEGEAEKLFAKLDKSDIDFDVLIATPEMMPKLGKYARLLGPRGLMPNPKSGTVTNDVAKATQEAKAGRVEYRVDQAGIVHLAIGKASFGLDKLSQNAEAVLASVRAAKPASLKGLYIKSLYVSTTMGPSIKVAV